MRALQHILCCAWFPSQEKQEKCCCSSSSVTHRERWENSRQVSCHFVKGRVLRKEAAQQGSPLGMMGQQGWERQVGNGL